MSDIFKHLQDKVTIPEKYSVSVFTAVSLTDDDVLVGSVFTYAQKCVLQNHLSSTAEQKVNIQLDPNNFMESVKRDSYMKGQIDMLLYLLECSDVAAEILANKPI